jgi:hypothetical protein
MIRTLVILSLLLRATVASAEIIGSHLGSANPTTEGWELAHFDGEDLEAGHLGTIDVAAVTGDMGFDAWEIVDNSSITENGGYSITLNLEQEADAVSQGFVMRTTMKSSENLGPSGARVFVFGTTESTTDARWVMALGTDPNGNPTVSVQGGGTATLPSAGLGYHTFELKVDPTVSSLATVSINGVEVLTDQSSVPAEGNKPRFIYFGSWSNFAVGGGRYSEVEFEILSPYPPGDFDEDGDVDGEDFLLWQIDPGVGPLSDWETHYGTVPPGPARASVP